jgi:hypothetical protein
VEVAEGVIRAAPHRILDLRVGGIAFRRWIDLGEAEL